MESAANLSRVDPSEQEGEKALTNNVSLKQESVVSNAEQADDTAREVTERPTGPKLALITLALCLGVFLVALGTFTLKAQCWA